MALGEAGQVTQTQKRLISPIVILIVALLFIIWLMALFLSPEIYNDYGMEISKEYWVYIGSIIMIVLLAVLMVASFPKRAPTPESVQPPAQTASGSKAQTASVPQATFTAAPTSAVATVVTVDQPAVVEEMAVVEAEPIVVEAEIVEEESIEVEAEEVDSNKPLKVKKPKLVDYPKKVPGGVYGDTVVRVDPYTKLNLRTLLVRSCLICDRQDKCWQEIQDTISRDDFLGNIECKKGLRKLKGHGAEPQPLKKKKKKMMMKVKQTG